MFTRVHHWSSVTRNGWSEPSSQLIVITVHGHVRQTAIATKRILPLASLFTLCLPELTQCTARLGRLWHWGDQTDSTMTSYIIILMQDAWIFLFDFSLHMHTHTKGHIACHETSQILCTWPSPDRCRAS